MADIKNKRFQFLQTLYNESEQDELKPCNAYKIGGALGFDENTIAKIIRYFINEGLILKKPAKLNEPKGTFTITHSGICHVEDIFEKRKQLLKKVVKETGASTNNYVFEKRKAANGNKREPAETEQGADKKIYKGEEAWEKFEEKLSEFGSLEIPFYPFKAGNIKYWNLTGKSDICKYGAYRFSKEDSAIIKNTVGSTSNVSTLRAYLSAECNVQNPDNYSWKDILAALEHKLKTKTISETEQGTKREQEGMIKVRKPLHKRAWAIIIAIIIILGGIWTVIQICESETFKSVFHDSKREVQIPTEKIVDKHEENYEKSKELTSPRSLTIEQQNELTEELSFKSDFQIAIACRAFDQESYNYAKQITEVFKNANWQIGKINRTYLDDTEGDVTIAVTDQKQGELATKIMIILNNVGISCKPEKIREGAISITQENTIYLIIGSKLKK